LCGDNIQNKFSDILQKIVDWIHVAQDRVQWMAFVNMGMKVRVPQKVGDFKNS
jgi:hypothetical protein